MDDYSPRSRDWAIPAMFFVICLSVTGFNDVRWSDWARWIGYGFSTIFAIWTLINFTKQAVMVAVDASSTMKASEFRLSGNYLADLVKHMNSEQLQTLRMYGSIVIQYLVDDDEDEPIAIIYGTEVSLSFAQYFLARSTFRQTCPIRDFMDGTFVWDWTGENRIYDRQQAREFTAWLIRFGYAEFRGGNTSALWKEYVTENGMKSQWTPERVMRKLGLDGHTEEEGD